MEETPDLADIAIALGLLVIAVLWPLAGILGALNWVTVGPEEVGLVYRFGRFHQALTPGRHLLWPGAMMRRVTTAPQTLHVRGLETTSRDGWPVQVTAIVTFQLVPGQARAAAEADVLAPIERIRHAVAFALCELADRTDLPTLLGSRAALDDDLHDAIGEAIMPPHLRILHARIAHIRYPPLARRHLLARAAGPGHPPATPA